MTTKVSIVAATALAAFIPALAGVTTLAHRATRLLHAQAVFHNAVLLEVEGTPVKARHPVTTADEIVKWHFVFDNQKTHNKYKTVSINAIRGLLGKPKGSTLSPVLQDRPLNPIPTMTLTRAVHLLDTAGWRKGFYAVTLRNPLYPGIKNAEYIFAMVGGKIVGVDAQTSVVKQLS